MKVKPVLKYIANLTEDLYLLNLLGKLCVLFLLVTAQRCQTLHKIRLEVIKIYKDKMILMTNNLLKQSRPN